MLVWFGGDYLKVFWGVQKNKNFSNGCFTHQQQQQQQPFNGLFSRTTWVSRYQKGKTNLDFTGARDSEWQWHQLGHMQVCTSLQLDNHASTPPLGFYRPDALPAAQPTASKHWRIYTHTYKLWNKSTRTGILHTHPFNGPLSRTTRVSRYQKGKTTTTTTTV